MSVDQQSEEMEVIIADRPVAQDSRIHWWLEVFEHLVLELKRSDSQDVRSGLVDLGLRMLGVAEREGDLSKVDALAMRAYLGRHAQSIDDPPSEVTPEGIVARAIDSITLNEADIPAISARERAFLLEDENAWGPRGPDDAAADSEFDQLDDFRRIVRIVEEFAPKLRDNFLVDQAIHWIKLKNLIQHGSEIGMRGRELLARASGETRNPGSESDRR